MRVVFQLHNAEVDTVIQSRAAQAVEKLAGRLRRVVDATVRVAGGGAQQRVEITLRSPRRPALVAEGTGYRLDVALRSALDGLEAQIAKVREARARRVRAARQDAASA
ncbi:HPF/RaiA family ribosome-associated protein [Roseisolibacter sp. H3M3-2]|uniref:HPF/RaiA family ribosome-associated protein n=1 Tax=Roseisolibacter sp. H3M3-2 TaxID=3031323 RepID=UPI0023DCDC9E|nr:HPF/RaiA family ribosome-associated protein [Roseisolibacter sp. H3M3-2]MDF1503340.1 HPF/RaiA family ribosome-associated protein [Roseisolibacter sp. H3M3-2]